MSIYLGAGSTAHKMSKLYVGLDDKARQVQKMYVGVDGKARLVYQSGTPIGSLAVGSIVKIKVNGTARDFIIVYQGLPGSVYDLSCNGAWLLAKDIDGKIPFSSNNNSYEGSNIHGYLNGTFYNSIDPDIRASIKQVKIPYHNGTGSGGSLATGSNGLSAKVFLLSGTEVGFSASYMDSAEGAKLPYFDSSSKRIARYDGSASSWWLRSPYTSGDYYVWFVNATGNRGYNRRIDAFGIRPAFILPSDTLVDEDGNVMV